MGFVYFVMRLSLFREFGRLGRSEQLVIGQADECVQVYLSEVASGHLNRFSDSGVEFDKQ